MQRVGHTCISWDSTLGESIWEVAWRSFFQFSPLCLLPPEGLWPATFRHLVNVYPNRSQCRPSQPHQHSWVAEAGQQFTSFSLSPSHFTPCSSVIISFSPRRSFPSGFLAFCSQCFHGLPKLLSKTSSCEFWSQKLVCIKPVGKELVWSLELSCFPGM